ncbi:wall-associated receptor kinase 5-like isoform X2 [Salvia hispanica]|uniref:wall-associated receptor kinase 5-like isoform X2 n=1 Tax=Salvia hispanica TaxID=49212 RepID=UPI0020090D39|nr:wall-associated receptor kinase 5-like isoform X2 [Salvia hispanica]
MINMNPLQLISVFLLFSPLFSAALHAKPGCLDRCGDLLIPYPFGVGQKCSLNPYFNIKCDTSTYPPRAYLSVMKKEVIEFNQTYIRLKNPYMISACYDLSAGSTGNQHGMSVNLSGTPYMFSYVNVVTAIGCDDMVVLSNRSSILGGCSAFCVDKNVTNGVGNCRFNGCCQQDIRDLRTDPSLVKAELIDLSGKALRKKLFPCSYAFIQERTFLNESEFSYPLNYLDNSTVLVNDNWASATRPPIVRLEWIVGTENCSRAKSSTTYACRDDKSVCVDNYSSDTGYTCSCVQGYDGNPYLPGGCQTISSSIVKVGCLDQCGEVLIPFPFGMGPNCYLEPSFEVVCNTATNPAKPFLRLLNTEIIELNSSKIVVNYMNIASTCYNMSDSRVGITKPEERRLTIDLLKTPYRLSDDNWINAIGCDFMAVGIIGEEKRSSIRSSCAAICYMQGNSMCHYGPVSFGGDGCCRVPIPRGTTYLEANLTELSERRTNTDIPCSYSFIQYIKEVDSYSTGFSFMKNSSEFRLDELSEKPSMGLDWRIGVDNCKDAVKDQAKFVCQDNSDCVDFDATLGGYLCNCSKGYKGNPYLNPGCQDIDECADNTTNTCVSNSICENDVGTFHCSCPIGYIGDGKKDGTGCIQKPPSKTKMIIFIGVGSGLGFVLIFLVVYGLYKLLQKRKNEMVKEKFFKQNGGILLQQQANECTLGKTKVFSAKELEVATDDFNESRIIGQGGQGVVYKEYFQSSQFTEKSDVYSFGVVLVELLSGQRPISFDKPEEERGLATWFLTCMEGKCVEKILDPQILGQGEKKQVILVTKLAQRCLNLKGRMRPTMKEVATELESFRISRMSSGAKVESDDVRYFEDMPTMNLDIEGPWENIY